MRLNFAVLLCLLAALLGASACAARSSPRLIEPSGPFAVKQQERQLATALGQYRVLVWMPQVDEEAAKPVPLILYAPGWGNRADDSATLLADLASHGYVAVAFDDIAQDQAAANENPQDHADRTAGFSLDSPDAYRSSFDMAGRRVQLAALKGSAILDAVLRAPDLALRIDPERIGFVGFSFGGATGVEQAVTDARVKAVVNLNGWVFGKSAVTPPKSPYLLFYIDEDFPAKGAATSGDAARQALTLGSVVDHRLHRTLLARPDFHWLHVPGVSHHFLSDQAFEEIEQNSREFARIRARKSAQFGVIRGFLDRYLKGDASAFPPEQRTYPDGMAEVREKDLTLTFR